MPVRLAQRRDFEAINGILTRAFFDEDVIGRVMHPHRARFPSDVIKYWRDMTRLNYWCWNEILLVATDEHDKVVGVADYTLKGSVETRSKPAWWSPRKLLLPRLVHWYNSLRSWWSPNKAADPAMLDILERAMPFIAHHWHGRRADGYYLDLLAVDPSAEGYGYGKELVHWGVQKAQEERVCISVISSYGKDPFYLKCGFESIVGSALEGDGNPLKEREVIGGSILFIDATDDP